MSCAESTAEAKAIVANMMINLIFAVLLFNIAICILYITNRNSRKENKKRGGRSPPPFKFVRARRRAS
jgi:hypothetical protein